MSFHWIIAIQFMTSYLNLDEILDSTETRTCFKLTHEWIYVAICGMFSDSVNYKKWFQIKKKKKTISNNKW